MDLIIAIVFNLGVFGAFAFFIIRGIKRKLEDRRAYPDETEEEKENRKKRVLKERAEEDHLINMTLLSWLMMAAIAFCIALLISSIIMANSTLSVKIILLGGLAFCIMSIFKLNTISNNQKEIANNLKEIFTSIEMHRLEPENKAPAIEIIAKHIEHENQMREIYDGLGGLTPKIVLYIGFGIYIGGTLLFTYLLIANWDYILTANPIEFVKTFIMK